MRGKQINNSKKKKKEVGTGTLDGKAPCKKKEDRSVTYSKGMVAVRERETGGQSINKLIN